MTKWSRSENTGRVQSSVINALADAYDRGSGQFNLVGYSYGSVVVAQAATQMSGEGKTVDNLILIGSPIDPDGELIAQIAADPNIGNVVFINISDDPFSAGIDATGLLDANAHFYFVSNDVGQQDLLVQILTQIFGGAPLEDVTQEEVIRDPDHDPATVNPLNQEQ